MAYCDFIWVIFLCSGLASLFFHLSSIFEVHGAGCTICTPRAGPRAAHGDRGGADCNVFRVSSPYALAALSVYFCVSTSWVASGTVQLQGPSHLCVCRVGTPPAR